MPEASPASDGTGGQPTGTDVQSQVVSGTSTPAQNQDANPASSTGDQGGKPKSMLDAVQSALEPTKAGASPAPKAGSEQQPEGEAGSDGKKDGSTDDKSDDLTDDELARLSDRAARRFRHLSGQVKELNGQIEKLTPDATIGRSIVEFAHKSQLSSDEINTGFNIMAAMKADPFQALQLLEPYVLQLREVTGQGALPADLQQAVNDGRVTADLAREIAQNRAKAGISTQVLQQTQQQTEQERQQAAHKRHVDTVSNAVSNYERQLTQSDPDYKLIAESVQQGVELRIRRDGFPKTEADAVKLVQDVVTAEKARMGRFRPTPKPLTPITGNGSSQGMSAPKSMFEVVQRAVGG